MADQLNKLSELLKSFYTINETLERLEQDVRDMRTEVSALRSEHSDLKSRVAALEEGRKIVQAEVRAVIAEEVADMKVKFIEAKYELQTKHQRALPPEDK